MEEEEVAIIITHLIIAMHDNALHVAMAQKYWRQCYECDWQPGNMQLCSATSLPACVVSAI